MSAPADKRSGRPLKLLLVAVEASGDALGAALMREVKARAPGVSFTGCGGPLMAAEGLVSLFPTEAFAVIGPVEAFRVWPLAEKRSRELAEHAAREDVDAAVLIDAWSFSKLVAERIKKHAPKVRLYKYVAPQVWASRPGRVKSVKALFEGVLCLFPFEPRWFEAAGIKAAFVGNPNFQEVFHARGDGAAFRMRHDLGRRPILVVAPGSRAAEVRRLGGVIGGAAALVAARIPDLAVVVLAAPAVEALVRTKTARWRAEALIVGPDEKRDALAAATAAIAKSGTITTELAVNRAPMVVVYKVDFATALWIRAILKTPFVSIVNIAAGREIAPEFLQGRCTAENIAGAVLPLLSGGEARMRQLEELPPLLARLGVDGPSAAARAAETLLAWLANPRRGTPAVQSVRART